MADLPKAPKTFTEFAARFPKLIEGWEAIAEAGAQGPLDERTARLVKLGIAVGAMREGAVHASVRKARALGIPMEAVEQVVALAAGTIGLPGAVAAWSWARDSEVSRQS